MVGNDSTSKKKKTDVCKGENPTKAKKKNLVPTVSIKIGLRCVIEYLNPRM